MRQIAIAIAILAAAIAHADPGDELAKIVPNDADEGDKFGYGVDIHGAVAVITSQEDGAGSAYLFDLSDPGSPVQLAKFDADDGELNDSFGSAAAINGSVALVGAVSNENEAGLGAAYLFDNSDPTDPVQMAKPLPEGAVGLSRFGRTLSMDGDLAIVGAYRDDALAENAGAAYLFDVSDPANPEQTAQLLASDGEAGDRFGRSVTIRGSLALVSAPGNDDQGQTSGSAYLFDVSDPATPVELAKLLPEDGEAGDAFGGFNTSGVALGDGVALVGAVGDDDLGDSAGAAYLFDISDPASPSQAAKLLAPDGGPEDRFGYTVAVDGGVAVVGARFDDENGVEAGSAYLIDIRVPGSPVFVEKLLPADGAAFDGFGTSSVMRDGVAIVTAVNEGSDQGAAYVFDAAVCGADVNGDGNLDVLDFVAFQQLWQAQDPGADCDANAEFNVLDFVCFQQLFQAGCE